MTKTRFFVLVTVANLIILAAGFYYLKDIYSRAGVPVQEVAAEPESTAATPTGPQPEATVSNPVPVVIVTNQFHWRQVESTNYRTYVANLRSIGCPESTIKDIILTDIMKLFAARRGQFFQNGREFKFWETNEKRALNAHQLEEREKQMSKIDKEVPGVLRDLLGINYEREVNKYFVDNGEDERRLSFVSEDKRDQLLALREELEGMRERLLEQARDGRAADPEAWKKITERQQQVLSQILTPSERDEYELRTSETADRLRSQLVGFNPTEKEFREIYRLWKAHDEQFAIISTGDENAKRAERQDRQRLEEEIKAKLPPERVVDYDRAKNQDYQQLSFFVERYELPASTVQTVFDIKQVAENAKQSLLSQKILADDQRQAGLRAIKQETEQTIRQSVGDRAFPAYLQNAGTWLSGLETATAPATK